MKKILLALLFVMLITVPAFAVDTNASGNNTSDYIYFDTDTDTNIDIFSIEPVYSLTFVYETEEVAWLDFEGNKITFRGDNIQAARILIDYHYYHPSDNNDYRLYLGNENNFIMTIIFTPDGIEYDGNFTVSSETEQFFNAVLNELQKREKFK